MSLVLQTHALYLYDYYNKLSLIAIFCFFFIHNNQIIIYLETTTTLPPPVISSSMRFSGKHPIYESFALF